MNATIGFYDMWDVEVSTFPDGAISDIKDQQEIQRETRSFKKMFSNYVGIGLDARVVYTVERHRTPIAFLNKVVYGLIGFLNFFRPMKRLEQTVHSITQKNGKS
jgi:diacylglycerol kinase family enzyme